MALVFTAFEYVPRIPLGHDRFEVLHPQRDSLVQLEMELVERFGYLTNIEVRARDTDTHQEQVVRAARLEWPEEPIPEELEEVRQNRVAALRKDRNSAIFGRPF